MPKYLSPRNAGLHSEPAFVGRQVAHLLDQLERINKNLAESGEGTLVDDCNEFAQKIHQKLRAEGWRIKVGPNDKWKVLPPLSKRVRVR